MSRHWLEAFRLRTLPLALSSIAMGGFLAYRAGAFRWDIFLLCILTTIFLQILSNLSNDYGDSVHGADNINRKGPSRAVQSGAIRPRQMLLAIIVFSFLSLVTGVMLLLVSFGMNWRAILFFLALGLLSIGAAITYTIGRRPYGYLGLGDVSVLIFFGLVGVMGSYYLFAKAISWYEVLPAMSMGLLSIAVLNINNIRDIESDKMAGKYSIPVRLGRKKAIAYHWILLGSAVLFAFLFTLLRYDSPVQFLFLIAIPLFIRNGIAITRKQPEFLDPYLKQMALSTLLFVLLFGAGLVGSTQ
ncbi:MAG TPA: 1,4-dihydroxy-2-naphthoate polyprenyltransferase [Chryseosolibacter sp.]|nr:1,4-dihydroxy-2-naphthoate polyprenyltransferase [Chryseosolibacter sp.]